MGKTGRSRRLAAPVSSKDHVRGSPLAKVTLVGYGDFTCSDCAKSYRAVKKIQVEMGSRLRYVFRSFSQVPFDKESEGAAEAAETAGAQGKFWEIHDRMFENQGASDRLRLTKHARAAGLNARQFQRDMRGHVHLARVRVVRKGAFAAASLPCPPSSSIPCNTRALSVWQLCSPRSRPRPVARDPESLHARVSFGRRHDFQEAVQLRSMTMKKLAITTFILGALAMGFSAQPAQAQVSVSVTIGGFYDELAPYGRWVNCSYGRCWVPRPSPTTGSHIPTADGFTRNTGGPGYRVTHGEAAHTTTGHG